MTTSLHTVLLWNSLLALYNLSLSLHSDGRLPCSTGVGSCRGARCSQIPVPDPRSARACYQLGKRPPSSGHQGWKVDEASCQQKKIFKICSRTYFYTFAFIFFFLQIHFIAYRCSADHGSAWGGQRNVLLRGSQQCRSETQQRGPPHCLRFLYLLCLILKLDPVCILGFGFFCLIWKQFAHSSTLLNNLTRVKLTDLSQLD